MTHRTRARYAVLLLVWAGVPIVQAAADPAVVGTIPLGRAGTYGIAVNPVTHRVYVTNDHVADPNESVVTVIDGVTQQIVTTIPVAFAPTGVAVNAERNIVYVANFSASLVTVIDGQENRIVATIPVCQGPRSVAVDPVLDRVYVGCQENNGTLDIVDGASRRVIASVTLPDGPSEFEYYVRGVAVNPATHVVYVTSESPVRDEPDRPMAVVDGVSGALLGSVETGDHQQMPGVDSVRNRVYVPLWFDNGLAVIDGASQTLVTTVPVLVAPLAAAVDDVANRVYVVNNTEIMMIDRDSLEVIGTLPAPGSWQGVTVDASLRRVYTTGPPVDAPRVTVIGERFTRYFAEGGAGAFFSTSFALMNPGTQPAAATLRFLGSTGGEVTWEATVPAGQQVRVGAADVPGLAGEFSTIVEADRALAVSRTVTWDANGYGTHVGSGVDVPLTEWHFAESATGSAFSTYYLFMNPGDTAAEVEMTFFRPSPLGPVTRPLTVPPRARLKWRVEGADLDGTEVAARLRAVNGVPFVVERAMYLSTPERPFAAGTVGTGVPGPVPRWRFTEGSSGPFFDTFLLLANPGTAPAEVRVRYVASTGAVIERPYTVAPESRRTIAVEGEDAALADETFWMDVASVSGPPVVAERSMWWGNGGWQGGHTAAGVARPATRAAIADVEVGGSAETFLLLATADGSTGDVRVTVIPDDGSAPASVVLSVSGARQTIGLSGLFSDPATPRRAGVIVEPAGATFLPLLVEASGYRDAQGEFWAAGDIYRALVIP